MKTTSKQKIYENWKKHAFYEDNYQFVIDSLPKLHEPLFPLKVALSFIKDLTYRKINSWNEKGLISPHRYTEGTGWRFFSWIDVIKLLIISDLRGLGVETKKIKKILDDIEHQKIADKKFCALEYFIIRSFSDEKILLVIDTDGAYFLTEKQIVLSHFTCDKSESKIIVLPFFSYMKKTREPDGEEEIVYRPDSLACSLFKPTCVSLDPKKEEHNKTGLKKVCFSNGEMAV